MLVFLHQISPETDAMLCPFGVNQPRTGECQHRQAFVGSYPLPFDFREVCPSTARLAINFFPDLITDAFADSERTMQVAKETGFPPERLMFEFAEHDRIDACRMADTIAAHRKMHMQTVFDDFGSGDVGLALLSRFTPDAIKLDPALIRGLSSSWSRRLLVEKMIEMARLRAVRLIAEGVETRADYEKLLALGVRYFQGYFIAHPRVG
ncbi:MAG: EAL domain-containing protein, partial [Verrucomicrobiaceae bacterium]